MNSTDVSIIVPVYNGADYVRDAIESILAQSHTAHEIIVIDDGSTDSTGAIVSKFEGVVRYLRQDNHGAPAARNRGITEASCEWVGFLDADDLYRPHKLEIQLRRFRTHPSVDVVMGSREHHMLCSAEGEEPRFERLKIDEHVPLQLGCGLFRRSAFQKVGPFDTSLKYCDDYDWFNRAREISLPLLLHDDIVLDQRVHTTNLTQHRQLANRFQLLAFKKSLDRRRTNPDIPSTLPALATFHESNFLVKQEISND
ncbi:MAG: glycosyltransferase family A protein [Pirellulaceae bacterium]|nr:glycosyltransferase family A protein [Pirellulaceae bacterium]